MREIFALFEQYRSAIPTLTEIERRGWTMKSWTPKSGKFRAGSPFAQNSLRRLLTNVLYTGEVCHKGYQYPGEHGAIVDIGMWKRVQALLKHPPAFAGGRARNKHNALLSGLLYCEACGTRMVYSYSGKIDRRYPYYVCLNAQRKGWAVCPAKSLPARHIEDSVLAHVQAKQLTPIEWEQPDSVQRVAAIQKIVERVGFEGTTGQVSIRFHPIPEPGVGL